MRGPNHCRLRSTDSTTYDRAFHGQYRTAQRKVKDLDRGWMVRAWSCRPPQSRPFRDACNLPVVVARQTVLRLENRDLVGNSLRFRCGEVDFLGFGQLVWPSAEPRVRFCQRPSPEAHVPKQEPDKPSRSLRSASVQVVNPFRITLYGSEKRIPIRPK